MTTSLVSISGAIVTWETFVPFTALHMVTVIICAVLIAGIVYIGRKLRDTPAELSVRRILAAFAIVFWVAYNTWWNWDGIDTYNGLPLQICDISGLVAPLALLTHGKWPRATLYFWAFAFTIQGFIQPVVTAGPAFVVFWAFWTAHSVIMACACYDLVVLNFRPNWTDFMRACVVSVAYICVVVPVNLALDSNYGYVGNPPAFRKIPPFVEALGPWPERVAIMAALTALAFALVLLPWLAISRRQKPNLLEAQ